MLAVILAAAVALPLGILPAQEAAARAAPSHESSGRSVFRISPARDWTVIAVAGVAAALPYGLAARVVVPRCPCDPSEVNGFDRPVIGNSSEAAEVVSDASVALVLIVPVLLDALDLGLTLPFSEDAVVFLATLTVDAALVSLAKAIVQRPLPLVYAGKAPRLTASPAGDRSFYSGHVSLAFAALSAASVTLDLRYDAGPWPWLATALLGTSVGLERVAAGRHFYTDVMVGAAVGILVGTAVPLLHRLRPEREGRALILVPTGSGLSLGASF